MLYLRLQGSIENKHRQLAGWMLNIELSMYLFDQGRYTGDTRPIEYGCVKVQPCVGMVVLHGFNINPLMMISYLNEASLQCAQHLRKLNVIHTESSVGAIVRHKNTSVLTIVSGVNAANNDSNVFRALRFDTRQIMYSVKNVPFTWNICTCTHKMGWGNNEFFLNMKSDLIGKMLSFTSTIIAEDVGLINLPSPLLRLELPSISEFDMPTVRRSLMLDIHLGLEYHVLNVLTGAKPAKKAVNLKGATVALDATVYVGPYVSNQGLTELQNEVDECCKKNLAYLVNSPKEDLYQHCKPYTGCARCFITGVPLVGVILLATLKCSFVSEASADASEEDYDIKVLCTLIAPRSPWTVDLPGKNSKIKVSVVETVYLEGRSMRNFISEMPIDVSSAKGCLDPMEKQLLLAILDCGIHTSHLHACDKRVFITLQHNSLCPFVGMFEEVITTSFFHWCKKIGAVAFGVTIV